MRACAATLLLVLAAGCSDSSHADLLVDLRTDLSTPRDFVNVRVTVEGDGDETLRREVTAGSDIGDNLLEGARVAELPELERGSVLVHVELRDAVGTIVVERSVRLELQADRLLTVVVTSDCVDVSCPGSGDGEAATECLGGRCVPPECERENPEACGEPECTSDDDCPADVGCAQGRCAQGACLVAPVDDRCSDGECCNVHVGCTSECAPDSCDDGNPCTDDEFTASGCTSTPNTDPCDDGVFCNGADRCVEGTCSEHEGDPCSEPTMCDEETDACVASGATGEAQQVHVPSFRTSSPDFVPVPGASLTFTPSAAGDVWLVLVSALLGSSSTAEVSAEARYLLDGEPRGIGQAQNTAPHAAGPWQHFDVVTGTTDPHTVTVQLRDVPAMEASLTDLRVIALPLPEGADPQIAPRMDAEQLVGDPDWATLAQHDFTPASPGSYLMLGVVNASERPGAADVFVRWQLPDGSTSPLQGHQNVRQPWQSFFMARAQDLADSTQSLALQAHYGGAMGSIRYARMLAFRTDAFADFWTTTRSSRVESDVATPVTSLDVDAAPTAADHLVVMNTKMFNPCEMTGTHRGAAFDLDGEPLMSVGHEIDNCAYEPSYGPFTLHRTDAPFSVELRLEPMMADVAADTSSIHVLRLP